MRLAQRLPERRWTRIALIVVAVLLIATSAAALLLRSHSAGHPVLLALIAATPFVMLTAPVGAILMVVARQWIGLGVALLVTALGVSTQLWLYTSDEAPREAVVLHVMTSNLRLGLASPGPVVREVERHSVDLLMLQEVTEDEERALARAGLNDLLPYHASEPGERWSGTGLWSRYPLSEVRRPGGFSLAFVTAKVVVPGVSEPVRVASLHTSGPVPDSSLWRHDMSKLSSYLPTLAGTSPTIVGGDFNATPDMAQFRRILDAGFRDAADQAGGGYTRTYPADRWFGPLIAIDHVLSRHGPVATDVETLTIEGSDHRALLATVSVPRG